jgi:hypothetical protein
MKKADHSDWLDSSEYLEEIDDSCVQTSDLNKLGQTRPGEDPGSFK